MRHPLVVPPNGRNLSKMKVFVKTPYTYLIKSLFVIYTTHGYTHWKFVVITTCFESKPWCWKGWLFCKTNYVQMELYLSQQNDIKEYNYILTLVLLYWVNQRTWSAHERLKWTKTLTSLIHPKEFTLQYYTSVVVGKYYLYTNASKRITRGFLWVSG